MTIATGSGGRQLMQTDDACQVKHAAAPADRAVTWLKDEEAPSEAVSYARATTPAGADAAQAGAE